MQTLQQKYAQQVYQKVKWVEQNWSPQQGKEYGTLALKLPVLVRQAGLVQALTFVAARGKDTQKRILDDLAGVLGVSSRDDLLRRAQQAQLDEYMYLTRQVLWALEWFKRFAQAILKVEPTDEAGS